jgi:hypothetical protein
MMSKKVLVVDNEFGSRRNVVYKLRRDLIVVATVLVVSHN